MCSQKDTIGLTRRSLLGFAASSIPFLSAEDQMPHKGGMASRGVKAAQRPKPSGRPFGARFVDIAASAGLKHIVVAGHADRVDYVLEAMSSGVAFFDYDNDGWLDILVLSGSRFGDPPANASSRLYRNN